MLQLPKPCFIALALAASVSPACASDMFASDSPWMFGDWGGTRSALLEQGYDFTFGYTGEMGSNLHGGYDHARTARDSDQFTFVATWTWTRYWAGKTPNSSSPSPSATVTTSAMTASTTPASVASRRPRKSGDVGKPGASRSCGCGRSTSTAHWM